MQHNWLKFKGNKKPLGLEEYCSSQGGEPLLQRRACAAILRWEGSFHPGPAGGACAQCCPSGLRQQGAFNKQEAENPTGDLTLRGLPEINFPADNISFFILLLFGEAKIHSFSSLIGRQPSLEGETKLTFSSMCVCVCGWGYHSPHSSPKGRC